MKNGIDSGLKFRRFSIILYFVLNLISLAQTFASGSGVALQMRVRDPQGNLIDASSVNVRVMILSEASNGISCVLRDETFQSVNIVKGYLGLQVGSGVRGVYDPNKDLKQIFLNSSVFSGLTCLDNSGNPDGLVSTYSPSPEHARRFKVSFSYAGDNISVEFRDKMMTSAIVAETSKNSEKFAGKNLSDFVQIPSGQPNYQSRLNDLVSDSGNAIMSQILGGTYALPSSRVTGLGSLATMTVTGTPSSTTYLRGDGTWAAVSNTSGTVTTVSGTAPITVVDGTSAPVISISNATTSAKGAVQVGDGLSVASGVVSLPDTGTAGTYGSNYQVPVITTDAKGRVTGVTVSAITINGSAITAGTIDEARLPSLDAAKIGSGTLAKARLPSDVVYNGGSSAVGIGAAAVSSALLSVSSTTSGFLMPRMSATQMNAISSPATGLQVYNTDTNQIHYYNGSSWQALGVSGAGVQSFTAGTGLTGGTITSSGTIAVDVGTTANKIVQLDSSARLPAVDASQVTGLTASQIPSLDAAKITTGTFTASQIPSLDWSKITTGKPTTISGYGITNAITNAGSVISMQSGLDASKGSPATAGRIFVATDTFKVYYDDGSSWVQVSSNTGTTYTAGTGLSLSGTTFSLPSVGTAGTYTKVTTDAQGRVTAGTTLSASDIPSLDAAKITTGTIGIANGGTGATTAGGARTALGLGTASTLNTGVASGNVPVIGVSGITNNKMCTSDGSGGLICNTNMPVSSITAGTGLTGGTITSSGTIAVDVGTTASKIVQLDASARLPAVDGSQLTGITASQIPNIDASKVTSGVLAAGRIPDLDAAKITTGTFTASQIPSLDWSKITTGKPTTISGYGITNAITNAGSVISMQSGLDASKGSAATAGRIYVATDTAKVYYDTGSAWTQVASNTGTGGTVTSVSGSGPISVSNGTTTPSISIATANGSTTGALSSTDWTTFNNKLGTTLTSGQLFVGNGSNVATGVAMSGDATMTNAGVVTVSKLQNRTVASTAPTNGQVLKWNSTNSAWEPGADTDTDTNTTYTAGTGLSLSGTTFSLPSVGTAGTYAKVTTDAQGRVTAGTTLSASDIPSLDAAKITTGTFTASQIPSLDAAKITTGTFTASQIPSLDWSKITTGKPTTISGYGITNAVTNAGSVISMQSGLDASKGSAATAGRIYVATDTAKVYYDTGSAWTQVASNTGTGGTVTSVSGSGPISVSNGTTTPSISIATANGSTTGALSSTDWTTFNNKLGTTLTSGQLFVGNGSNVATGVAMSGDATMTNAGVVTVSKLQNRTVASTAPTANQVLKWNNTSSQWEPSSDAGLTSETDPSVNALGKATLSCSTNQIAKWNGTTWVCSSDVDTDTTYTAGTGLSLSGTTFSLPSVGTAGTYAKVTTDAQGRVTAGTTLSASDIPSLDVAKISTGTIPIARGGTNSGTTLNNNRVMISSSGAIVENAAITASRAIASDASGLPVASTTSATELGYLTGVTSAVQTQLNGKASSSGWTNYSVITSNGSGALTAVAGSSAGQMLNWTVTGPAWTTATFPTSTTANQLLYSSANNVVGGLATANNSILTTNGSGVPSWTAVSGDAFTQYALLAGRSGGQTINGGTAASNNLTLDSTSNATKGNIILNPSSGNVGIGMTNPTNKLDVNGNGRFRYGLSVEADILSSPASYDSGQVLQIASSTPVSGITYSGSDSRLMSFGVDSQNFSFVRGNNVGVKLVTGGNIAVLSQTGFGIGTSTPTAALHLKAGTATANTAPLKLTAGTNLTTPEAGAIEFDGTSLYYTDSTNTRRTIATSSSASISGVTAGTGLSGGGTSGNVTLNLSNVGTAGTYAKVTTDAQGRVTAGTTLSASDIPSLDMAKITTGTLGIANGGTGATTAAAARTSLGLGTAATLNTGVASGNIPVIGTSGITNNRMCTSDGSGALICNTNIPTSTQWTTNGSDISYTTGNVGIGTSSPDAKLDVAGGVQIGDDTGACNSTRAGTLKYVGGNLMVCNGTAWLVVQLVTPSPNVVLTSGSGSNMNVTGPGSPAYGSSVVFTYQNQGTANTVTMSASLSSSTNFDITADTCTGNILTPSSSCSVTVRPKATANGSLSANLTLNW